MRDVESSIPATGYADGVRSPTSTRSEEPRVVVNVILVILLLGLVGLGGWFVIRALGSRRR
jgi:hypothetical protein